MISTLRLPLVALAALGMTIMGCGDDNDPVAAGSLCDKRYSSCIELTMTPDDMTYSSTYDARLDKTMHRLHWNVSSEVLSGYAPGRRIVVKVNFKPPVQARYSHPSAGFFLQGGYTGCSDRYLNLTANANSDAWSDYWNVIVCGGECDTGVPSLGVHVSMVPRTPGNGGLSSVLVSFDVPDTFTSGAKPNTPVLPGDIAMQTVEVLAQLDGDTGPNPPQWQGEYTP